MLHTVLSFCASMRVRVGCCCGADLRFEMCVCMCVCVCVCMCVCVGLVINWNRYSLDVVFVVVVDRQSLPLA